MIPTTFDRSLTLDSDGSIYFLNRPLKKGYVKTVALSVYSAQKPKRYCTWFVTKRRAAEV